MEIKNTLRSMDDFLTSQVTVGFQTTIKKQTGFRLILVKSFKCVLLLPREAFIHKAWTTTFKLLYSSDDKNRKMYKDGNGVDVVS